MSSYRRDVLRVPSHHLHAKTLEIAVIGTRRGLSGETTNFPGLAIFADDPTNEGEWQTWRELWLR